MERFPRTPEEAEKLLKLSDLLRDAALIVKEEWAKEDFPMSSTTVGEEDTARLLPSRKLWEAEKTIEAISGSLVELVSEPAQRIQQVLSLFMESRALFIAAERNIPDLLAEAGHDGLDVEILAEKTNIAPKKLGKLEAKVFCVTLHAAWAPITNRYPLSDIARVLRTLCSIHVFNEVDENRFANNRVSAALVKDAELRAYVHVLCATHTRYL